MKTFSTLLFLLTSTLIVAQDTDSLWVQNFNSPPDSVRPLTWWHWMNGHITEEGITADLKEMKEVGLRGAQIFNVTTGIPPGPVEYNSDLWHDHVEHAMQTAEQLGLELGMQNCAGWATTGGPWITPEYATQRVVWTEKRVEGPFGESIQLEQPFTLHNYYRDIAVYAFPTPEPDIPDLKTNIAKITVPFSNILTQELIDDDYSTGVELPISGTEGIDDQHRYIDVAFKDMCIVRAATVKLFTNFGKAYYIKVFTSKDGKDYEEVRVADPSPGWTPGMVDNMPLFVSLTFEPVQTKYLRLYFTPFTKNSKVLELDFHGDSRLDRWPAKSAIYRVDGISRTTNYREGISKDDVVQLSQFMDSNGNLDWEVPAGDWTIIRFGHTTTGKTNHPAPLAGKGLECDKMNPKAVEIHFNAMLKDLIGRHRSRIGDTFTSLMIDSYEADGQNWTANFESEFEKLRGYNPLPYLITLTGRLLENNEVSERFLWDFRKTIAELYQKHHYEKFTALASQHGLKTYIEGHGNGIFDNFANAIPADVPTAEFSTHAELGKVAASRSSKEMASVAHAFGKPVVAAEAYTGWPRNAKWKGYPYLFKAEGDLAFSNGVNEFLFHTYTHQPYSNIKPGMTMGHYGMHIQRNNTWWPFASAWMDYLARCQYLLQAGKYVADINFFVGEGVPTSVRKDYLVPLGYDYDFSNDQVIFNMEVADKKLCLSGGMEYKLLVLPDQPYMTLALVRKIEKLVKDGAIIYGPKPMYSPSLGDYGAGDGELKEIVSRVWGDIDGKGVVENTYGKGKVFWGMTLKEALGRIKLVPDVAYMASEQASLSWIHRKREASDIYFVANARDTLEKAVFTFRVENKKPQLWNPINGAVEDIAYYDMSGKTAVPLELSPYGSAFVVFTPYDNALKEKQIAIRGEWNVAFPEDSGAPDSIQLSELISLTDHNETQVRYFSGTATYTIYFNISEDQLTKAKKLVLDLGEVNYIARAYLNGHDLGILWTKPFAVEVTDQVQNGKNHLKVEVANLWGNRLIGDQRSTKTDYFRGVLATKNRESIWKQTNGIDEMRFNPEEALINMPEWVVKGKDNPDPKNYAFATWKHLDKDAELQRSGLLGPVIIRMLSE